MCGVFMKLVDALPNQILWIKAGENLAKFIRSTRQHFNHRWVGISDNQIHITNHQIGLSTIHRRLQPGHINFLTPGFRYIIPFQCIANIVTRLIHGGRDI